MSLFDPKFFCLALFAIVTLPTLRGTLRQLAFLLANLAFVWLLLSAVAAPQEPDAASTTTRTFVGATSTLAFCVLGYVLTRVTTRRPRFFPVALLAYVLLFIYMRNYEFLQWVLPEGTLARVLATVGLSFLFFKIVHVMIEARSGTLGPLEPLTYLNYCLNFTTFMMGPIQRYQDFYAQWHGQKESIPLTFHAHLDAAVRIVVGLFKAYVIAEWLAPYTLTANSDVAAMSAWKLLLSIYAFYGYLYFNFAGYCDVVIGIGSLFGVRPPENFDKPFLARNISEFWLRQHRSLTLWLTDYVFSPLYKWSLSTRWLGAHPLLAMNIAVFVTLFVSGVWHGTTVSFIIFGIVHGLYQVVYRTWDAVMSKRLGRQKLKQLRENWAMQAAGMVVTFNAVAFAFLFFRLDTAHAFGVLARLGSF